MRSKVEVFSFYQISGDGSGTTATASPAAAAAAAAADRGERKGPSGPQQLPTADTQGWLQLARRQWSI